MVEEMNRNLAIAITGIVVFAVVVASVLILTTWRIATHGRIKALGLEVFADPECSLIVSEINWGTIPQGGKSEVTLYLRPKGTVPCNFSMSTENYDPIEAQHFLTLTWNYNNATIQPNEVVEILFTLNASTDTWGIYDFSFDITLFAHETEGS